MPYTSMRPGSVPSPDITTPSHHLVSLRTMTHSLHTHPSIHSPKLTLSLSLSGSSSVLSTAYCISPPPSHSSPTDCQPVVTFCEPAYFSRVFTPEGGVVSENSSSLNIDCTSGTYTNGPVRMNCINIDNASISNCESM